MVKYKEYYNKMVEENKDQFDQFTQIHFEYSTDQDKYQDRFNKEGGNILNIIHEWENRLCKTSEKAGYSSYTGNLAEKFQNEVRNHFPLIDHVGIVVKQAAPQKDSFTLKKITLK